MTAGIVGLAVFLSLAGVTPPGFVFLLISSAIALTFMTAKSAHGIYKQSQADGKTGSEVTKAVLKDIRNNLALITLGFAAGITPCNLPAYIHFNSLRGDISMYHLAYLLKMPELVAENSSSSARATVSNWNGGWWRNGSKRALQAITYVEEYQAEQRRVAEMRI